jgi:hypothetical protein
MAAQAKIGKTIFRLRSEPYTPFSKMRHYGGKIGRVTDLLTNYRHTYSGRNELSFAIQVPRTT